MSRGRGEPGACYARPVRRGAILLAAALLLAPGLGRAQRLPFGVYSIEDGLADPVVLALFQDTRGHLWVGTRSGVSRFDGADFVSFSRTEGLAHNVVRDILETADGAMWFATEGGVTRWQQGTFTNFTAAEGMPGEACRCLAPDPAGGVWVGTYGDGLRRIRNGRVELPDGLGALAHGKVRAMIASRAGDLWVGTAGGGVSRLRDGVVRTWGRADGVASLEVRWVHEDRAGTIWIATREGLRRLVGERFEPVHEELLGREIVNAVIQDSSGRYWLATREGGVLELVGDEVKRFTTDHGLAANGVNVVFEDREGSIWFGTYGGGLCRLSTQKILNYEAHEGFPYANVYGIAQDGHGDLWFGTNGGGVSRLSNGRWSAFTTADGLPHDKAVAVTPDGEGGVWFGTLEGAGHYRNGRFERLTRRDGLAHDIIYHVARDSHGAVWFATYAGLSRLLDGQVRTFTPDDGLPDERVNYVLEGADGTLWVGTGRGLARREGDAFVAVTTAAGPLDQFVNHILEDRDGSLWLCSDVGLGHLVGDQLTTYTTADGLSHNSCTVALQAVDGTLWVGTNRGVNRFDGSTFSVVTAKDGLVGDVVNRGAGFEDSAGNLWFGTTRGVSQIMADFAPSPPGPPPVLLERVAAMGETVDLERPLVLPHDRTTLRFEFAGISFRHSRDVVYRYRLDGLEPEWQLSRQRSVQYASLPAGRYTFQVTARAGDGPWNPTPATFRFRVLRPTWQQPWFLGLVSAAVVGGVWWRGRALRRRAELLEARVRERTAEVEKANEELRWLALHDRLTNLRNRHYVYAIMPDEMGQLARRCGTLRQRGELRPEGSRLGLALLDLDHFKRVNDTFDHSVGDAVLERIAERLRRATRDADVVARWGGEEFLILFRDVDVARLGDLARRVLETVRAEPIPVDAGGTVTMTCSIGYTYFPAHADPADYAWDEVVRIADAALHTAKEEGRDRAVGFCLAPDRDPREALERLRTDLPGAVAAGLLVRIGEPPPT